MSEPKREYLGILGALSEAADIQRELGCTAEESYKIQSDRSDERLQARIQPVSNVLQFRPRGT